MALLFRNTRKTGSVLSGPPKGLASPPIDWRSASAPFALPGYLMTLSWFPASAVGGVNQAILNLARVMGERGRWRPLLLVTCETEIPALHPHLKCETASLYLRPPDDFRSFLAFCFHLPRALLLLKNFLEKNQVSVVNCHFPDTESIHFVLLRSLGIYKGKLILSFHGEDIRSLERKPAIGRWFARWMMWRADTVAACSQGLLKDLVAFEPACAKHSTVIYNAIDIDLFHSKIDRSLNLPARFLLNVARYEHKKGQDILLSAFEKVAAQFPDLTLVTIGTSIGQESNVVRAMVEKAAARDQILMLENVPHAQIGAFMEAAEMFVLPSRREGFPFVLLEAGAMQMPVVAAACIGVPEIIEDDVTGLLVPVEDAEALADAIIRLRKDPEMGRRLAARLHEVVLRDFSWETVYQRHESLCG